MSEDASKIDQYCTPELGPGEASTENLEVLRQALYADGEHSGKVFYAFVVKVLLGAHVHTTDGEIACEPCEGEGIWVGEGKRHLGVVPGTCPPVHFHSLIAEQGEVVRRHREFISFDGDNILVSYLVAFHREWDDDIIVKIPGKVKVGGWRMF